uniref:Sulfotransferase n=1 Tax=Branchiostoma floridae TaxID=7739 RepID=C3Z7G4_BRAFL|eukprot:XP_002595748.1 hypothetical protein BRAFLDRAFT_64876 [Branchiostoma floridae]
MAYVQLVQCKSVYIRNKDGSPQLRPNSIDDFDTVGKERPVADPAKFFRDHGRDFYVYCADFDLENLVLVRPREGFQIREVTFVWQALRTYAQEVLVVPFANLAAVTAEVADDVSHITTVFLHHTALDASGVVHGVSEPGIHISFLQYLQSHPNLQEDDLTMLTDIVGYSNTLFNFTLFQQDHTRTAVCYKTRAEGIHIAELLQKGVPGAKVIISYRDAVATLNSALKVMIASYWKYWLLTGLRLDTFLPTKIFPRYVMSVVEEDGRLATAPVPHGLVWIVTCLWLRRMQSAHTLTQSETTSFVDVVLRYEELCKYKEEMVLKLLKDIGIECKDKDAKEKIRAVFGMNSQTGTMMSGTWGKASESWVGDWEKGVIATILTHANMDVNRPDFVLEGTITEI